MIFPISIVQVHFVFLLMNFIVLFSISYEILQYIVYYYCILIRQWKAVGLPLYFFPYSRLSSYLLRLSLYLISFLLFTCASARENTRV